MPSSTSVLLAVLALLVRYAHLESYGDDVSGFGASDARFSFLDAPLANLTKTTISSTESIEGLATFHYAQLAITPEDAKTLAGNGTVGRAAKAIACVL